MYKSTIYLVRLQIRYPAFTYYVWAIVLVNPDMLAEKKYSPPLGMMKIGKVRDSNGCLGSSPTMLLTP